MFVCVCVCDHSVLVLITQDICAMSEWDVWELVWGIRMLVCVSTRVCVHFYPVIPLSVLSFLPPKGLWKIPGRRWWLGRETSDTESLPSELLWSQRGQYFPCFKSLSREKNIHLLVRSNDLCPGSVRTRRQGWA